MRLNEIIPDYQPNKYWAEEYRKWVSLYVANAKEGKHIRDWDHNVRETLLASDNHVSSLMQGNFSHVQREALRNQWDRLIPLLKQITNTDEYLPDVSREAYDTILPVRLAKKCELPPSEWLPHFLPTSYQQLSLRPHYGNGIMRCSHLV